VRLLRETEEEEEEEEEDAVGGETTERRGEIVTDGLSLDFVHKRH